MSILGIPSTPQLQALADGVIDRAKAAGVSLEDHGGDVLRNEITAALAQLFADVKQAEDPILVELQKANESIRDIADTVRLIGQGIRVNFGPPPQ
jgi:hypothetical protein